MYQQTYVIRLLARYCRRRPRNHLIIGTSDCEDASRTLEPRPLHPWLTLRLSDARNL